MSHTTIISSIRGVNTSNLAVGNVGVDEQGNLVNIPMDTSKITRLEIIDKVGRIYTKRNAKLEVSIQDEGRTMKIFVSDMDTSKESHIRKQGDT